MAEHKALYVAGVDLGGTKIEVGLVDGTGQLHECIRLNTEVDKGPKVIAKQIADAVEDLRRKKNISLLGVGVGVPGQVEAKTEKVVFAPNLKWKNVSLKQELEGMLHVPVHVVNDVRTITLGEWVYGAGKGYRDILCVFIGTGIGGGIVSDGHFLTGSTNCLGEVGHLTIDVNGPMCTCGKQGCFEAVAGGWGIARRAQEAIEADGRGEMSQSMLSLAEGDVKKVTGKIVFDAYHANDPLAQQVMQHVQKGLIAGLSSLVNLYNPACLILGGGVLDAMPKFFSTLEEGIKENALKVATEDLQILPAQLKKSAGVIGAAVAIFRYLECFQAR